jgi:hypothetical protein
MLDDKKEEREMEKRVHFDFEIADGGEGQNTEQTDHY